LITSLELMNPFQLLFDIDGDGNMDIISTLDCKKRQHGIEHRDIMGFW
jgi:hypothetical protein